MDNNCFNCGVIGCKQKINQHYAVCVCGEWIPEKYLGTKPVEAKTVVKRDLKADLEICERMKKEVSWQVQNDFIMNAPQGWPEAIERAIAAEEQLDHYKKALAEACELVADFVENMCPVDLITFGEDCTTCSIKETKLCWEEHLLKEAEQQLREGQDKAFTKLAALTEENDIQRASIQQLSAQVAVMQGILRELLPNIEQQAEMIGYGLYNPADPREFTPDFESCTEKELARWKEDCRKTEAGEPIEHAGPTGWGIGTYVIRDAKMAEVRDRIKQALASPDPGEKHRERMEKMQAVIDLLIKKKQICDEWQNRTDMPSEPSKEFVERLYDVKDIDRQIDTIVQALAELEANL